MTQWVSFVVVPSWWDKMVAVLISGGESLWCSAMLISCHITPSTNNPRQSICSINIAAMSCSNIYRAWYERCLWQPHGMQESLGNTPRSDWWDLYYRVPTRSLFPGKVLTFDHGSLGPGKVLSFSNSSKRSGKSPYFLIKSRLMNRCLM